jgi:hypothetical protein
MAIGYNSFYDCNIMLSDFNSLPRTIVTVRFSPNSKFYYTFKLTNTKISLFFIIIVIFPFFKVPLPNKQRNFSYKISVFPFYCNFMLGSFVVVIIGGRNYDGNYRCCFAFVDWYCLGQFAVYRIYVVKPFGVLLKFEVIFEYF